MQNGNQRAAAHVLAVVLLAVLLSACGRPATLGKASTPAGPLLSSVAPCDLNVSGRWITGPSSKPVVLNGANLPTLSELDASHTSAEARLRDLAAAGARIVRLSINTKDLTPTFVPAKVAPIIQQANQLGMIVILGWDVTLTEPPDAMPEADPLDTSVDDAEDWLRLEITYLSNNLGVWFDLYNGTSNVSPLRQRNIAQRLVDVARGFKANNILVVNDPAWLLSPDPAVNKPLEGGNIVYGIDDAGLIAGYAAERFPFIVTRWADNTNVARLQALNIGAIATYSPGPIPASLSGFWQAHPVDWAACRGQ